MPKVGFSDRARDDLEDKRRQEDKDAIGGMRNPRLAVRRLTRLQITGKLISDIIDAFIQEHPELITSCTKGSQR